MQQSLAELTAQFLLEGIRFSERSSGYSTLWVENRHATAEIALQGAQVMTYQPQGQQPVIWLSSEATLKPGKSIRGGVPICWPWFGPHAEDASKPGHGYARTVDWRLLEASHSDNGATQLTFELIESDATRALWPHPTPVRLQITVGQTLLLTLSTHNAGPNPLRLSEALHTYFAVSDIADVAIVGLEGVTFYDKVDNLACKIQEGAVKISSEVDRVYINTNAECIIEDPGYQRRIHILAPNCYSTIVWNPWQDKAQAMGDLGDNGYRRMVCLESGNALENSVNLPSGETHEISVEYRVEAL